MLTHFDTFSGHGGTALAAHWAGFTTVAFCEIDPAARLSLQNHWPGTPVYHDITSLSINPSICNTYRGVTLVTGTYPCQPYSNAGFRGGEGDPRHLWPHLLRIIAQTAPSWVLLENVTGHITMGLDDVLADLESAGYAAQPLVIPACALGECPHIRERVYVVAHATGNRPKGYVCEARPQAIHNGAPQTLDPRHWARGPFSDWKKLMGESELCRVYDGVSSTVDIRPRLHAYGEAVVPQVIHALLEPIAKLESQ